MKEQIRTIKPMTLLDEKGKLRRPSWASCDIFEYNKDALRHAYRRKEWEFYQVSNPHFVFQATYGHLAYAGLTGVTLIDRDSGQRFEAGPLKIFPGDSLDLDFSTGAPHRLKYEDGKFFLSLDFDGEYRRIRCRSELFDVDLMFPDEGDAIVTATPFRKKWQFYYNYKKSFLELRGRISVNGLNYPLEGGTFILLDSGRGIWPRDVSWVWGSGAKHIDGHVLSANIGWGFGYTGAASENALFWDGELHKLSRVREQCNYDDFMQPWRFFSDDKRFEMEFTPQFDNYTHRNYLLVCMECHQVFGTLRGQCTLDDGTVIPVEDMDFFCEHAVNHW